MSRERRPSIADVAENAVEIEQRPVALREMLTLIAPETGTSALGGKVRWRKSPPRRPLLLPSPDAAANL
jgi:hypothetical protein